MAEILKNNNSELNTIFYDYFSLSGLNNFEYLYIVSNEDFKKININLSNLVIIENQISNLTVNDNNPIFLNLKLLNSAKEIYLKDSLDCLNDSNIKDFIKNFKGIIICSDSLTSYLIDLGLISDNYNLKRNTYLKIDKYGIVEEITI